MSTPEDRAAARLREALRARTDSVHPTGSFEEVRERAATARRTRRLRVGALSGLAAAAVVAVAVLAVSTFAADDRAQEVDVGPVAPGSSSSSVPVTTVPDDQLAAFIFVTGETDPRVAAERFAVEYLGMDNPVVGEFQQGGPVDGEVPVRPNERGPVTTVGLREVADDHVWGVAFAVSDNIRVATPGPLESISSPVRVTGEARGFEGTVQVEVRRDGQLAGESLGGGFVTGSGGPEHGPFEGEVPFERTEAQAGAVVFYATSAEDGSVWEATVVRVAFGEPAPVELVAMASDRISALDPRDGSVVRDLVTSAGGALSPAPTALELGPDGDVIAVMPQDSCRGSQIVRLTGSPTFIAVGDDPAVSPDGRRIAFSRDDDCDGENELVVLDMDTGEERVLWGAELDRRAEDVVDGRAGHPSWSPDGLMIAFEVAHRDGSYVIVTRIQEQGATSSILRPDDVALSRPAWVPAGTLAIVEDGSTIATYEAEAAEGGIGPVERLGVLAEMDGPIARLDGSRGLLAVSGERLFEVGDGGAVRLLASGYTLAAW